MMWNNTSCNCSCATLLVLLMQCKACLIPCPKELHLDYSHDNDSQRPVGNPHVDTLAGKSLRIAIKEVSLIHSYYLFLRILAMHEPKTAKMNIFWPFCPVRIWKAFYAKVPIEKG